MKLNKREKVLLLVLLIVIVSYVYINFVYLPTTNTINALEIEKKDKENQLVLIENEISKKESYEKLYQEYSNRIIDLSNHFYSEFYQEDFILFLKNLTTENFSIREFSFRVNEFDDLREQLEISLEFDGSYLTLYDFIDMVNKSEKNLFVNQLNITSEEESTISGEMTILAERMPNLSQWINEESFFAKNGDLVEKQFENPFKPYPSLAEKYSNSDEDLSKIELYYVDREVTPIDRFNTSPLFFVGTDKEVFGEISYSKNRLFGNHSISLDYNFGMKKTGMEGNIVFKDNLIINDPKDFISIWAYSDYATGHEVGLIMVDAQGVSHDITLTNNVDFKDWKVLESEIPLEVSFPSKVQRIYVKSSDNDQRLRGKLLFDQLQLADEKEVAEEE